MTRREAVLLIGPTGSGKSPLGDWLQDHGWGSRPAVHFDFGDNLRRAERGEFPLDLISAEDRTFIRQVLKEGAVLEEEKFFLAGNILESFLRERGADEDTVVILNGFPRHEKQAEYVEARFLRVRTLVSIEASAETVLRRLEANSGGDRTHRTDDADVALVRKKLRIFHERTLPLIEWYTAHREAKIVSLVSETDTSAADMAARLKAEMQLK